MVHILSVAGGCVRPPLPSWRVAGRRPAGLRPAPAAVTAQCSSLKLWAPPLAKSFSTHLV